MIVAAVIIIRLLGAIIDHQLYRTAPPEQVQGSITVQNVERHISSRNWGEV